jgi:hypothetical protein
MSASFDASWKAVGQKDAHFACSTAQGRRTRKWRILSVADIWRPGGNELFAPQTGVRFRPESTQLKTFSFVDLSGGSC